MSIPKINATLYGRLFTQGKTYFETTLQKYSYSEQFKLNYNHYSGQFKWLPQSSNTFISNIMIKNLKTFDLFMLSLMIVSLPNFQ